jgi:tRNA threonylcarbamoyl adenosine modification protein YeaZ/ribosomal-protein-alanine acetyltransferase
MKILALDTAMAACSVAVIDSEVGRPLASAFEPMERGHAEALAPMVQHVMAQSGLRFSELDRIAVSIGPGTFTGVRIGLAMARGLGLALGLPVTGIDTLSAIAANETGCILVTADARKDEVYTALIENGRVLRPPSVATVAAAARGVASGTKVIGTAAAMVVAASGRDDLVLSVAGDLPLAARIAAVAAGIAAQIAMPSPLYLRAPDAKPQTAQLRSPDPDIVPVTVESARMLADMHAEAFDTAWTAEDFTQLLNMPGAAARIALEQQEPVGFILTRRAADEAEIICIATRPFAQRRGTARALALHVFNELLAQDVRQIFIEVAQSNVAAQALYGSMGFREAGLRRGYYERANGGREDAIVMRKDLTA